jgi:hypothetical protein
MNIPFWIKYPLVLFGFILVLWLGLSAIPPVLYPGGSGGDWGLKPVTYECIGVKLGYALVQRAFSPGDNNLKILGKNIRYNVIGDGNVNYCFGQDIIFRD